VIILRAGQTHNVSLSSDMRITEANADSVAPWYLSGGISAANCIAAYTPKGAASLTASYDNNAAPANGLPDGTYDAAPGVAPGFDTALGWLFTGTQYLTTGIVPVDAYSAIVKFNAYSQAGAQTFWGIFRNVGGDAAFMLVCNAGANIAQSYHGSNATFANNTPKIAAAGTYAICGKTPYRDGAAEGSVIGASAGTNYLAMFIGARNSNGAATSFFIGNISSFAVYNATLTAPQLLAVHNAMP